jgi:uncharacterized membrane protein
LKEDIVGSAIIIVTWDDMERADKALEGLRSWQKEGLVDVKDAVVVVKDEAGEIEIEETQEFTAGRGAVAGGVAGAVIGLMVGGPIGGALLGGAAGALAAKKVDIGVSDETIEAVSESMENASSAILAQLAKANKDALAAAIRQSGGKLHELSIADDTVFDIEGVLAKAGSAR